MVEMCNFRSEHSSMHLERLQDLPHPHKKSPQGNDPEQPDTKEPKPGGVVGSNQPFQTAGQVSSNGNEAGTKCQKQKCATLDSEGDSSAHNTLGAGKRACSNSSESDDSTEVEDKQRQTPGEGGGDSAPGVKNRAGFEDDDDERTDSADEGGNMSDSNYDGLPPNSRDGKFRINGEMAGPSEKTANVFVTDHHTMVGPVSPVNMVVGYGGESLAVRGVTKKTSTAASLGSSPPLNSPRHSSAGQSTPDTPSMLSPEVITSQVKCN